MARPMNGYASAASAWPASSDEENVARSQWNSVVTGPRNRPNVKNTIGPLATVRPSVAPNTTHQGLMIGLNTSHQSEELRDVVREDLLLLDRGTRGVLHGGDALADRRAPSSCVERCVAAEEQVIGAEEITRDVHRTGRERARVAVELLEVLQRVPGQLSLRLQPQILREHVEHGLHPPVKKRNHGARMMDEDSEIRVLLHHAAEHQPHHGARALVRPAEDLPDQISRVGFRRVVRMTSTARRVQQDGDVSRRQHLEYGAEFAGVKRTAVHVAVDLDRAQAELPGGAFDFVAR